MDPFYSLSDENQDQVRKYLKFFRQKREAIIRTIKHEFRDAKNDRLEEMEMFSREDMENFVDFLESAVTSQMAGDLSTVVAMSTLAVSQILENAQNKGIECELDTSAIENQSVLDAISKINLESIPKKTTRHGGLNSLKDAARVEKEERQRLESINEEQQEQISTLLKRLSVSERMSRENDSNNEGKHNEDSSKLRRLQDELDDCREEQAKSLRENKQFKQLREEMKNKNMKIKDLQKRLLQYEPDFNGGSKEDDDY